LILFYTWFRVAENDGLTGRNGTTCKGINGLSTCTTHTKQRKEFNRMKLLILLVFNSRRSISSNTSIAKSSKSESDN
jgi:hypothetical protein